MPPRAKPTSKKAIEGKRYPLNIRTTHAIRRELETAAAKSGRSLAQEAELRIELSLSRQDYLIEQWGKDFFNIAESAARSLSLIEQFSGKHWTADEETFQLFTLTVGQLISNYRDIVRRTGHRDTPSGSFKGKTLEQQAEMFAASGGISPPFPRKGPAK
jgi:hypothetical protein